MGRHGPRDFAALSTIGDRRPPCLITVDVFRGNTVSLVLDAQVSMSAYVSSKLQYSSSGLLILKLKGFVGELEALMMSNVIHSKRIDTVENPAPKTQRMPLKKNQLQCFLIYRGSILSKIPSNCLLPGSTLSLSHRRTAVSEL
jgi:hypothetical protein